MAEVREDAERPAAARAPLPGLRRRPALHRPLPRGTGAVRPGAGRRTCRWSASPTSSPARGDARTGCGRGSSLSLLPRTEECGGGGPPAAGGWWRGRKAGAPRDRGKQSFDRRAALTPPCAPSVTSRLQRAAPPPPYSSVRGRSVYPRFSTQLSPMLGRETAMRARAGKRWLQPVGEVEAERLQGRALQAGRLVQQAVVERAGDRLQRRVERAEVVDPADRRRWRRRAASPRPGTSGRAGACSARLRAIAAGGGRRRRRRPS